MLLPRQSKAIPRQRCTQNATLREITQTPPSESHRLLMSLPRIPIVTHAQTDATHQLSHVRRQVCHVRTVGDRQRHTPSECYTCMLLRLPCAEWLHHGDIHYQPMDASLGQSAPLFSGQKSVRIASHALECRRPSLGSNTARISAEQTPIRMSTLARYLAEISRFDPCGATCGPSIAYRAHRGL